MILRRGRRLKFHPMGSHYGQAPAREDWCGGREGAAGPGPRAPGPAFPGHPRSGLSGEAKVTKMGGGDGGGEELKLVATTMISTISTAIDAFTNLAITMPMVVVTKRMSLKFSCSK